MAIEHNTQRPSSIWLLGQVLYVYRNTLTIRYLRNTSDRAKNQGLFSCKKSGISIGHFLSCHDIVMRFSVHPPLLYVNKNTTYFSLLPIFPIVFHWVRLKQVCLRSDDAKLMETIPFLCVLAHKLINLHSCEIHSLYV